MKIKVILLMVMLSFITCSCNTTNQALIFKKEYESLNGKVDNNVTYRKVSIDKDNPYKKVSSKDISKMIKEKKSFYLYFGNKKDNWCRSVIEKSIQVAKENSIDSIYYVNIDGNKEKELLSDILDDKKISIPAFIYIEKGKVVKEITGISDKQKDATSKLTESILQDDENIFNELFSSVCEEEKPCE